MKPLAEAIRSGNRLLLSRLLSAVENNLPSAGEPAEALFRLAGQAKLVGVTGSPGTGKSTLVNQLALAFRREGGKVAVLAVDPTSPFSGGALLGDRVRMREAVLDEGIFIRSVASRGSLGGLGEAVDEMVDVLDGAGFDWVLIETVGAGQSEVDIAQLAHSVVVVEAPGLGDEIQALKAGILEIADILVVNKMDLPGGERAQQVLQGMLEMRSRKVEPGGWEIPVLGTTAAQAGGVEELVGQIHRHRKFLLASGALEERKRRRRARGLSEQLRQRLFERWRRGIPDQEWDLVVASVSAHEMTAEQAVRSWLDEKGKGG